MGRAWLPSQRHGRELESGEPACLPLFSQRALFVACFHRLSRRRAPWLPFFPILPITAYFTLTYSTPQRGNMSSSSPHIVLKGPSVPCGNSALPLLIDLLNPRLHSATYQSVFLSLCLAICLQSLFARRGSLNSFC